MVITFAHSNVPVGEGAYAAIANEHSVICDVIETGEPHLRPGSLAGTNPVVKLLSEKCEVHNRDTIHLINVETGPDHSCDNTAACKENTA